LLSSRICSCLLFFLPLFSILLPYKFFQFSRVFALLVFFWPAILNFQVFQK
jgi:hypothetical protein